MERLGDYARKPELLTFDRAGDAELYGNTVLGLACRYYDLTGSGRC